MHTEPHLIRFRTEESPFGEVLTAELRITATAFIINQDMESLQKQLTREIAYLLAEKMLSYEA